MQFCRLSNISLTEISALALKNLNQFVGVMHLAVILRVSIPCLKTAWRLVHAISVDHRGFLAHLQGKFTIRWENGIEVYLGNVVGKYFF